MIEILLPLDNATMGDLRRFVALTQEVPDDWEPFAPDYSHDQPAQLYADLDSKKET